MPCWSNLKSQVTRDRQGHREQRTGHPRREAITGHNHCQHPQRHADGGQMKVGQRVNDLRKMFDQTVAGECDAQDVR